MKYIHITIVFILFLLSSGSFSLEYRDLSVDELNKLIEQNDTDAMHYLGAKYGLGSGVELNKKNAIELYLHAAEEGNIEAQFDLAIMYDTGNGIKQDKKEAFKWYSKAASQDYGSAEYNLGVFYLKGLGGVDKDIEKAIQLFKKVAQKNIDISPYALKALKAAELLRK